MGRCGEDHSSVDWDVILVGGGLANGLIAYRLKYLYPQWKILLIEQQSRLGGNHTWSFHDEDISQSQWNWISPLVSRSWDEYTVHFPAFSRTLHSKYHSVKSEKFHSVLAPILGESLLLEKKVKRITASNVELHDGTFLTGRCIIDGRGFGEVVSHRVGYQKFVGQDVTLFHPHGLKNPILMDVNCPQEEGFRFFYLLPWSDHSLLIEDTRYSNSGSLNVPLVREEIQKYLMGRGWRVSSVDREEVGALPIPLVKDCWTEREKKSWVDLVPRVGVRGDWFHPVTGYSFCYAVQVADLISQFSELNSEFLCRWMEQKRIEYDKKNKFYYLLNRMLFLAAKPVDRYQVLQRFYQLNQGLIQRFYSGRLKFSDTVRILSGKPPVPVSKAVRCLFDKRERIQLENSRHDV